MFISEITKDIMKLMPKAMITVKIQGSNFLFIFTIISSQNQFNKESDIIVKFIMKRNPVAKALRTPKFKKRIVKNKKKYNRKKINKLFKI